MNKQSMVREFMQRAEQPIAADTPHIPTEGERRLRCKLILEEAFEYVQASGYVIQGAAGFIQYMDLVDLIPREDAPGMQHDGKHHLVDTADAIADLLYVVYGAAVTWGINIDQVFGEVHRSNMTKFIDGHRREDGKWQKGPSYEPPRIAEIIASQSNG